MTYRLLIILLVLFAILQTGCGTLNSFYGQRGVGIQFGEQKQDMIGTSIDSTSRPLAKPIKDEDVPPSVTLTPPDVYPDDEVN